MQDRQKLYEEFAHRAHSIILLGTDAHQEWDKLAELFRQFEREITQKPSEKLDRFKIVKLRNGRIAVVRCYAVREGVWPFRRSAEKESICDAHGRTCGAHNPFPPEFYDDVVDATIAVKRFADGVVTLKEIEAKETK